MKYEKILKLRDGRECTLRNGATGDGKAVLDIFILTHEQTDFLASYADECTMTAEEEDEFLQKQTDSKNAIEIVAEINGNIIGMAGIEAMGSKSKMRHRADFGISIDQAYWGLGIGKALTEACIECAREAGYEQLELQVVAENEKAISLYKKVGFIEYGRDPRGFKSRISGYQELVYMRLEL